MCRLIASFVSSSVPAVVRATSSILRMTSCGTVSARRMLSAATPAGRSHVVSPVSVLYLQARSVKYY